VRGEYVWECVWEKCVAEESVWEKSVCGRRVRGTRVPVGGAECMGGERVWEDMCLGGDCVWEDMCVGVEWYVGGESWWEKGVCARVWEELACEENVCGEETVCGSSVCGR